MKKFKTYSELITFDSFLDRYRYLKLNGNVGEETFGFDRYLNQEFYHMDPEWKSIRDYVILRDNGCDLGVDGYQINSRIFVHHLNPITAHDIFNRTEYLLDPEFLISTCKRTHDAIHFGDESLIFPELVERKPNDTCPWRRW